MAEVTGLVAYLEYIEDLRVPGRRVYVDGFYHTAYRGAFVRARERLRAAGMASEKGSVGNSAGPLARLLLADLMEEELALL